MSLLQKLHSWRAETARKEGVELYRVFSNATLGEIARVRPADKTVLLAIKGIAEKKYRKYGKDILEMVQDFTNDQQPTTNNEKSPAFAQKLRRGKQIQMTNIKEELDSGYFPRKENSGMTEGEGKESSELDPGYSSKTQNSGMTRGEDSGMTEGNNVKTVGEYLDFTNTVLQEMPARVKGEISSIDIRGSYLFFTIKDSEDEAALSVFMWRNRYDMCGVALEEGMEVIVEGHAEVYKPSGRFSFRADSVELVGEGALKAAYEKLKSKLESEGLFAPEQKRRIPHFPQRIGLITSRDGAVIHDFLNNIGRFGYVVRFVNSRVEGQLAVPDLLRAVRMLSKEKLDVLVVIRGGGSLESLQAFNNESLVRAIAGFPVPVICGIGHDQDVPLASMAADAAVSTPTAATKMLNATWEQLLAKIDLLERNIVGGFERRLYESRSRTEEGAQNISRVFSDIVERCRNAEERVKRCAVSLEYSMNRARGDLAGFSRSFGEYMLVGLSDVRNFLRSTERHMAANDPRRQLRLGYSIARVHGKVVRSVKDVHAGEDISVLVSDGEIEAKVTKAHKRI